MKATSFGFAQSATQQRMASERCGELSSMERQVYDKRSFRNLLRERCVVSELFGPAVGECQGYIHLHHVDPSDADSKTLEVCNRHHQRLHAALRALTAVEKAWKTCPHRPGTHRYPGAKEACERRLNQHLTDVA